MNQPVSRRTFLKDGAATLVAVSAIGLATPCCRRTDKRVTTLDVRDGKIHLDLRKDEYRPLNHPGNGVRLELGPEEAPLLVLRVSATEVTALSSECTHAGYQVLLPDSSGVLVCSSGHGGRFDATGKVLQPPPRKDLTRFETTLVDGFIVISHAG